MVTDSAIRQRYPLFGERTICYSIVILSLNSDKPDILLAYITLFRQVFSQINTVITIYSAVREQ